MNKHKLITLLNQRYKLLISEREKLLYSDDYETALVVLGQAVEAREMLIYIQSVDNG